MAYAKRVDSTHGPIKRALKDAGVIVFDTSGSNHTTAGRGGPDLLCWSRQTSWVPLWVKRPKGRKTESEIRADAHGVPLVYVNSVISALHIFDLYEREK